MLPFDKTNVEMVIAAGLDTRCTANARQTRTARTFGMGLRRFATVGVPMDGLLLRQAARVMARKRPFTFASSCCLRIIGFRANIFSSLV